MKHTPLSHEAVSLPLEICCANEFFIIDINITYPSKNKHYNHLKMLTLQIHCFKKSKLHFK